MFLFRSITSTIIAGVCIFLCPNSVDGQTASRSLTVESGQTIEVTNPSGRIRAVVTEGESSISAASETGVAETEMKVESAGGRHRIIIEPSVRDKRIDVELRIPARSKLKLRSQKGEIAVEGDLASVEAETETGTIAVDVPETKIDYLLRWLTSRPRYVADFPLSEVKERSAGRFEIKGEHGNGAAVDEEAKAGVELRLTTVRGIILINVPPNEVTADLRERDLTTAAKAIIRSGDSVMMDAIRRAAPKFFGDYVSTLPPIRREPEFAESRSNGVARASVKRATVTVTDSDNRAISGLRPEDFEVVENGEPREIISVRPVEAPVNLVLLLDVSGSIDNYVTFIRKAARSFVNTTDKNDRVSIVLFSEDVKVLADFTTDKATLSESLDTFDAGGATAYYDALGYVIAESLRPLQNERTAVVILTDGDDNRSFLAFDSLIGAIEESGSLIYPLYVPSSLIAASAGSGFSDIDPLRNRHLTLTTKAEGEGERLAKVSGGQYYSISQLSQIQTAYEDIVVQLRTAYDITYRSELPVPREDRASPRLRVKVKKPNAFAQIGPVVAVR